jgi:NAD-dependent dihydropyrimidine dehydrogenase PreA subunit
MTWPETIMAELRKCTDCGLCLAACPTFAVSRAEGDSPRGRTHLITTLLAGGSADQTASAHLSSCIECAACHSPCPTGVKFATARRTHRVATDRLDRSAFERRVAQLADAIARDPGAGLTVRAVRSLLADTNRDSAWHGPLDGGVLALTGTMLRLAAPKMVDRLEATLAACVPDLIHDPQLSSALDRASGLLLDVGLSAEHDRAVACIDEVIAARRYERLTIAVFDVLATRLAREALPPQLRVVPAPTAFATTLPGRSPLESAVRAYFGDDPAVAEFSAGSDLDIPAEARAASAPVLLTSGALAAVHDCVEAKRRWLRGRPLITPDSRDLVRLPDSRHVADLMSYGGSP